MSIRNTPFVWRLAVFVLLAALLLAPAGNAAQAQIPVGGDGEGNKPVVTMATLRDVNDLPGASGQVGPDLLVSSFLAPSATLPLTPGATETFWVTAEPVWTASGEHVDSFFQFGPTDWNISAISNAPANNRGTGLAVGQAYQQPNTGGNSTDWAHAYWGYVPAGGNSFNYVNGTGITPPTRSWWSNSSNYGVYTASASGGTQVQVSTDFSVPASWSAYLCPGANSGTADEYIGMSGVSTDPNYMETWLYSSDCSSLSCPVDVYQIPLLPCRQPAVSVTKTGTVTGVTGNPGEPGTITVQYCFVVTNATTPGAGVHLASYQVTDSTIGYNSGPVTYALAPGASAPQICAPPYVFNITWPATGNVCVTNTSGASATGTTPPGWRETTAGVPANGFSTGTFTSPAATGGAGLQTCASPLAVALAEFSAVQQGDAVQVSWETVSELDNAGFNLYRSESAAGPQTLLTYLPASSPGGTAGAAYAYEDRAGLTPGQSYYYWLEDVAISGATTLHGPVSVDFVAPTAVTLGSVAASPAAGAAALPWLWVAVAAGAALALGRRR